MRPTILIVDDSPSYRSAARALLEAEGFEVVGESTTGGAALTDWEHLRPDVVLLDIGLPDIDGIAVAERLTARPHGPAVVLVSSRDGIGCEQVFHRCGARGFIPKAELSGEAVTALAA
jgi:DNA-binding NarL/FixJ family response regulator